MTRRILGAVCVLLMLTLTGCGSSYVLKKGGWSIVKDDTRGTCLTVHGDGDPEVVTVCILAPEPVKLSKSVLAAACPVCTECPPAKPAEGETDGAD